MPLVDGAAATAASAPGSGVGNGVKTGPRSVIVGRDSDLESSAGWAVCGHGEKAVGV